VTVNPASIILVKKAIYSVPSRLIAYTLTADVFPSHIEVRYGKRLIQTMNRLPSDEGASINYRHIIGYLLRKPGAFANYQYRDSLFPRVIFRKTYDALIAEYPARAHKLYLEVLQLAAIGCENSVACSLSVLHESGEVPTPDKVKELMELPRLSTPQVKINLPNLAMYDGLLSRAAVEV
jgi:hypothetical protein